MYSRTRTFDAEVHKSIIRVTRWHNKCKILNCIKRNNFRLSDLLTLSSYKVEKRTFGHRVFLNFSSLNILRWPLFAIPFIVLVSTR